MIRVTTNTDHDGKHSDRRDLCVELIGEGFIADQASKAGYG